MDQRHKVLRQSLLGREHRGGRHAPVSFRRPHGATDEKLPMLIVYINIGALRIVKRLQKGIAGM
jgi:hypothetical protein